MKYTFKPVLQLYFYLMTAVMIAAQPTRLIEDIPYAGTDNPRQMLDLILPGEQTDKPLPVIAFIHGGGWRNGSRKAPVNNLKTLVSSGNYAGVSIGYRLSGEAKWPSQIHDCKAAVRWIRANARKYGLDPDRIAVWGSSAGGHLVAMMGTSGDVPAMDGAIGPHTDVSSRVQCVIDYYGPTNFLLMEKMALPGAKFSHDSPDSPESLLIGAPIQEHPDIVATANPITYVSADDPPFLIVHGNMDPLVPINQSELLHAALTKASVETTMITVNQGQHGKGFGSDVRALVDRFLDHHLRGIKTAWADQTVEATIQNN